MKIITKQAAMSAGLKKYFTGKPCVHGHIAERYTNKSTCVICALTRAKIGKKKYLKPLKYRINNNDSYIGLSWKDAFYAGMMYYEGKKCGCGNTKRYVRNSECPTCNSIKAKSYKLKKYRKEHGLRSAKYCDFKDILTVEEAPILAPDGKSLFIKCAKCKNYFIPKYLSVRNRIISLRSCNTGENRLYCSETCKETCAIYNKRSDSTNLNTQSRTLQPAWRKMVLTRDNFTCRKCGYLDCTGEGLIAHHIDPVINNPIESADIDNGITVCNSCDKVVHSVPGCGTQELRCN